MTSNFRTNNVDLLNIYKTTNPISLPLDHYLINRSQQLDDKFSLYKFGTRKKSYFLENGVDIGSLFQIDSENFSFELGVYSMAPWNMSTTSSKFVNAKWIWNISTAATSAPGSGNNPAVFLWYYYTFYSNTANTGTIYGSIDNQGIIYLNGTAVLSNSGGSWPNGTNGSINILKGLNYIRVACYNDGIDTNNTNPAGLLVAVYDSGNNNIANTNSNWSWSQVASSNNTIANYTSGGITFNATAT
jgi:hypothetical protein